MSRLSLLRSCAWRLTVGGIYRLTLGPAKQTLFRSLSIGGGSKTGRLPKEWRSQMLGMSRLHWPFLRCMSSLPTEGTLLEMPSLSPTMDAGGISKWVKKEGDKVMPGEAIAEIATDKATVDWDLTEEGYLAKILCKEGSDEISVGTPVAVLVYDEKDIAAYKDFKYEAAVSGASPGAASPSSVSQATTVTSQAAPAVEYPEHRVIEFPALSPTMERGGIGSWIKKEGEFVASGEALCTIVTDKATNDYDMLEEGYIAKILMPDGTEDLDVGVPIAIMVEDKDTIEAFKNYRPPTEETPSPVQSAPASKTAEPVTSTPSPTPMPQPVVAVGGRIIASPYAKKLAAEAKIQLGDIGGTGPGGRIVASDIQDAINRGVAVPLGQPPTRPPTDAPYIDIPLTQIRKVIAARLTESKQTIPHYYLTIDCIVDDLVELRKKLNARLERDNAGIKLSINDFVIKAAAFALRNVPEVNSSWQGEFIRQYNTADISVAVQTPMGLMVPIVRNADAIGLQSISSEVKSLAEKAKNGKLKPEEFTGGTFTVSNLGMFGITQFCAIVNPPQAAILAVGGTQTQLFQDEKSNTVQSRSVMRCTLSCDHRVVDGAIGAEWLKEFRNCLEQPLMMLL